jgi:hypothetical protein
MEEQSPPPPPPPPRPSPMPTTVSEEDIASGTNQLHLCMKTKQPIDRIKMLLEEDTGLAKGEIHFLRRTPLYEGLEARADDDCILTVLNAYPDACSIVETEHQRFPLHMAVMAGASYNVITAIYHAYPPAIERKSIYSYLPIKTQFSFYLMPTRQCYEHEPLVTEQRYILR